MDQSDLWVVRRRLDTLARYRLGQPLSGEEQAEYDALGQREAELLDLRRAVSGARDSDLAHGPGPKL